MAKTNYSKQKKVETAHHSNYDKEVNFYILSNQNFQNEISFLIEEIKESKLEEFDKNKLINSYEKKLIWYKNNPSFYSKLDNVKVFKIKNLLKMYNSGKKTGLLVWGSEKNDKKFQLKLQRNREIKNSKVERLKLAGLGVLPPKPKTNFQFEE